MKFFYHKFLTVFVILFFAFNAKAVNDTLTIGQAFDWSVGDTLIYMKYNAVTIPQGPPPMQMVYHVQHGGLLSFQVLAKQNFQDSVIFQIHFSPPFDTVTEIIIRNTDSLVTSFTGVDWFKKLQFISTDWCHYIEAFPSCNSQSGANCNLTIYYDPLFDNRLTVHNNLGLFETGFTTTYVERAGLEHAGYSALEYYEWQNLPGGCGIDLVYYHSDSIIWTDTSLYHPTGISEPKDSPSFRLFPNPASDELTLTTDAEGVYSVSVYDVMENCVSAPQNFSNKLLHIKVNHLPAGYYYLKLTDEHSLSSVKGFIVAH